MRTHPRAKSKFVFTATRLDALPPAPRGKRPIVWDAGQPSLGIRLTDKGRRSFVVVARIPGDPKLVIHKLGDFPGLTISEARKRAAKILGELAGGIHPGVAKKQAQQERERQRNSTLAVAFADFVANEKTRGLRSRGIRGMEVTLNREFLPGWGNKPITDIKRRDIIDRLDEIKRYGGKFAARHALAAIRKFFNWCEEGERYGVEISPTGRIRDRTLGISQRDLRRTRVLDDDELRDVWRCAEEAGYPYGPVVQLLLLTGQRLNDINRARWKEISTESVLTVPAQRYKTGIAQAVPLSPRAVEILSKLPRFTGPHIFTAGSGTRSLNGFSTAKNALDAAIAARRKNERREPMPGWVLHDLRRTVRTRLVGDCGVDAFTAERVIGHTLPGLHAVYDQATHLTAKADALARWERRLLAIVEPGSEPPAAIDLDKIRRQKRAAR